MRTVVVAKFVPTPPNSGDKRRTLGVVRALRQHGDVVVCAFAGPDEDPAALRAEGVRVETVPRRTSLAHLAVGWLRTRSLTAARFWDPALARAVDEALGEGTDVLVIEHVQLLTYARRRAGSTTLVLDMHNIESVLTGRMAAAARGPRRWVYRMESLALRALERRSTAADVVAVVSDVDATSLARVVRHPTVVVVPNAWDEPVLLAPAPDPVVSFVALLSWSPNVQAALWFVREVWPRVTAQVPEARLQLVGRNPAPELVALGGPDVVVTGTVPDLTPWYEVTRVAVAPLLAGGGSRLKILEALAAGRPVVATTIGAEGLEDLVGRGVVVADSPEATAAEVVRLLLDPDGSAGLGRRGAAAVGADHSWAAAVRPLVTRLVGGHPTGSDGSS